MAQLVRRDFLKKSGVRFYEGIRHEDELYTPLIMENASRTMCIADKLVMHRMHSNSIMGSGISYKTIVGYFVGYCELMAAYIVGGCQTYGLKSRAESLYNSALSKYRMLSVEERQAAKRSIPEGYYFIFQNSNFVSEQQLLELKSRLDEKHVVIVQQSEHIESMRLQIVTLQTKLINIQQSFTFRIGRCITFIPRKIRKIKGVLQKRGK